MAFNIGAMETASALAPVDIHRTHPVRDRVADLSGRLSLCRPLA
jgi:hypothetical protein